MPRDRDVVMKEFTPEDRRKAVLKKTITTHEPYKVFKSPIRSQGWVIVLDHPRHHTRTLVMEDVKSRTTANDLRELLEMAWAEGYTSSGED